MSPETTSFQILSLLAGNLLASLILLMLFFEFRDLLWSKPIKATVVRIVESPSTDTDGNERVDRFPEIEFMDPRGHKVTHTMMLTNVTSRKPGDQLMIHYRSTKNEPGYKVCAPFMWPKVVILLVLLIGASLLFFAAGL
jgi:hypothetical protein